MKKIRRPFAALLDRRYFPALLIVLALAVGMLLPQAVLAVQGVHLEKTDTLLPTGISVGRQSSETAKLDILTRFYNAMENGSGDEIELSRGRYMTAEQVLERVTELKTIADAAGLPFEMPLDGIQSTSGLQFEIQPDDVQRIAIPVLVVFNDESSMTSSIVWVAQLYWEKNEHLEKFLEPVTPFEFYREIFPVGSFERKGHFEDAKGNGIAVTVPPKAAGIALEIKEEGKAKRYTITDELSELSEVYDTDFTIMSPLSYFGRRRCGKNARYLYALVFDLDGVGMPQLRDTLHQMNKDILPQATFVVNSGTGLHLYYVLEEPIPMYPHNQKCLKELKYSLTRQIWNRYTSTIKEPQMQGILQGFRVVGSGSKLGREYPVTAYRLGGRVTLEKLLEFIPDSNGEQQQLLGLMRKGRLSLAEAKEKYPDWYERRIVKKERRGRWTVKRDLYDWWLHRIEDEIKVGHRFYGIMTLAIYAKKCGIDEKELRRDAFSLLKPYDDMSVEDINRFTKDDVVCALEMFNEDYVTFPRDDVAKISGLSMPVNKRNWRKQWEHLQFARGVREVKGKLGETVSGGGRPAAQDLVYEWRRQHPEGRKADCHRDTGLDPKTIRKWWDCPPPAVRVQNGHITVRVSPSQAVSDLPVEALGQSED